MEKHTFFFFLYSTDQCENALNGSWEPLEEMTPPGNLLPGSRAP